jgi:hypothetical protein
MMANNASAQSAPHKCSSSFFKIQILKGWRGAPEKTASRGGRRVASL